MIKTGNVEFASVRYCSQLGRNVVFQNCYSESGDCRSDCLNKSLCGYTECGCRNLLLHPSMKMADDSRRGEIGV